MPDNPDPSNDQPPLNREQRRAQKFHRGGSRRQDNLQTQRENTSGFLSTPPNTLPDESDQPDAAVAESTNQGPTHQTGPGTGGATESGERQPHHEGAHAGNPTQS
jgi:hypothetical protein